MKLAIVGTYWPNYSRNRALISGLIASGAEVIEKNYQIEKEKMEKAGDLNFLSSLKRISNKLVSSIFILKQYQTLNKSDAIVVLYPGHLDLPAAWILSKLTRKPLIFDAGISLYDTSVLDKLIVDKSSLFAHIIKLGEKFLLKLPDRIMVDTAEMKTFLNRQFGVSKRKVFVIPISANTNLYKPKKQTLSSKSTQVFFFGLYNPLQGATVIAQAAAYLKNRKDINITMLGQGPTRTQVETIISDLKLTNIKLEDFVPEKELVKKIQSCDIMLGIFANTSITKRVFPNKVFAGLACAKPVITADHPPINSVLEHKKSIYVCPAEDPKALASAIKSLSDNKSLRQSIGETGYQIFRQQLSPEAIGVEFINQVERFI